MDTKIEIRVDTKLKMSVVALAQEKGLELSPYIRMLLIEKVAERVKTIVNVNVNNVVGMYEVGKATKYEDLANIIHHRLNDDSSRLAIRATEDYDLHNLLDHLNLTHFEFEDDVLYIR